MKHAVRDSGYSRFTNAWRTPVITAAAVCLTLLLPGTASAVSLGQADDFEDGTTQDWMMGVPINASNIPTGGPAGIDDNYLQSVGFGTATAGGKITIHNAVQWTGNYTLAGVTAINVDLNNFTSDATLNIRLGLYGDGGKFVTSDVITLDPSSGWMNATFSLNPGDLVAVSDGGAADTRLPGTNADLTVASVLELRFINSADPLWTGVPVAGTLGIDNITATVSAVPLPAAFWLFGSGLLGLISLARRKRTA